jgi:hypothetical protein
MPAESVYREIQVMQGVPAGRTGDQPGGTVALPSDSPGLTPAAP